MAGMTWVKTIDFGVGLAQEFRVEENLGISSISVLWKLLI